MRRNILLNLIVVTSQEQKMNATSKAREDIEELLKNEGVEVISISYKATSNRLLRGFRIYRAVSKCVEKSVNTGDNVWVQYPIQNHVLFKFIAKRIKKKNCNLYYIIHDIDALRYEKDMRGEVEVLNFADAIIMHTDNMKTLLQNQGVKAPMLPIYLFPYLTNDDYVNEERCVELRNTIAFAGNLKKSGFIEPLLHKDFRNIQFNFYGLPVDIDFTKYNGKKYIGSFKPNNVSFVVAGWGLVWDGNSIDCCEGNMGNYLRYNSPHKLSLYIAAGMPVIVWKNSALSEYIEQKNIGITVNSLLELDEKIGDISEEEYKEILRNVRVEGEKLRKGEKFIEIIREIIS